MQTLVIRFLTVSDLRPDGQRTVFFELNGQPREVSVRDRSQRSSPVAKETANPGHRGHVGAPTPGMVTTVTVEQGQVVEQNQKLLVLEAMKMQSPRSMRRSRAAWRGCWSSRVRPSKRRSSSSSSSDLGEAPRPFQPPSSLAWSSSRFSREVSARGRALFPAGRFPLSWPAGPPKIGRVRFLD